METTLIALAMIAVAVMTTVTEYLCYRKDQDRKREQKEDKEALDDEVHNGHNLSRIQHLAGRVRD